MATNYFRLAGISRKLMFGAYILLLLMFTLGTLVVPSCNREPNVVIWVLNCLPPLFFLPAMLRRNLRALAWLCFILLFYFLMAVPVAFACVSALTTLEVVVIVILFIVTMLYIRWQSRANKQQSNPDEVN